MTRQVVIVGAGLAGIQVARALRDLGSSDHVVLIGDEPGLPYDRPPLSKEVLSTGSVPTGLYLCSTDELARLGIEYRSGTVQRIDRDARRLIFADGSAIDYQHAVLATGGQARTLPQYPPDNVRSFALRTLDDAMGLSAAMRDKASIAIIGAGWLGLEVASVARSLHMQVTVADVADRPCARVLPVAVSTWIAALHRAAGVQFRLGSAVSLTLDEGGVRFDGGEPHDLLLTAIGMNPRDALAIAANLECNGGVLTHDGCRTSDPAIFAVGDVAAAWHAPSGGHLRQESWKNAVADARICAASMMGAPPPPIEAPWFWSEQQGRVIQAAGWLGQDDVLIDQEGGDRPIWRYGQGTQASFVIGVDRNRDVRQAHREFGRLASIPHGHAA